MSYDLKVERLIDATPEEVYDAFLDRDGIAAWYQIERSWTTNVVAHDARVGDTTSIEFGGPEGWRCREDMTYTSLERPHRIVYAQTFTASMGEQRSTYDTTVTVTLSGQDGKTLLTLVETGYPDASERDSHQNGWPRFLESLERVVVRRRSAAPA